MAVIISKNRNPFKLSLVTGQVPSSPERDSGRLVGKQEVIRAANW